MIDLKGRVALITGAASPTGLGFGCAKVLAEQGAAVFLTDVDERIFDRVAELGRDGVVSSGALHDVTKRDAWEDVVAQAAGELGRLDILINNAGVAIAKPTPDLTDAEWRAQIDINLTGTYYGCAVALEVMRRQGRGGAIINISSISGLVGSPATAGYCASKGGVTLLTKSLAMEYAAEGIRINSIHPGMITSEIHDRARAATPEIYENLMAAGIPMQRMGVPRDIGTMAAFLASDAANYITGAEFVVDGGFTAR